MPPKLIPNLLYWQTENEYRVKPDKAELYSDWYEFEVDMKCPVQGCVLGDFKIESIGAMFGHFEICHNNRQLLDGETRIYTCNYDKQRWPVGPPDQDFRKNTIYNLCNCFTTKPHLLAG